MVAQLDQHVQEGLTGQIPTPGAQRPVTEGSRILKSVSGYRRVIVPLDFGSSLDEPPTPACGHVIAQGVAFCQLQPGTLVPHP